MKILTKISQCRKEVEAARRQGLVTGLVPTMGYLHQGHLSLVKAAGDQCQKIFLSIFVNPIQFGPGEDLQKYPRDPERDMALARENGVDYVFYPEEGQMYAKDHLTYVSVERLAEAMCGAHRPGHFRGVATVVLKLFNIIPAHKAYFGRKDYQQLVIIKKMAQDLNVNMEIIDCPTVRESNGLALSSRNKYLSPAERENASIIYRVLKDSGKKLLSGKKDPKTIKKEALEEFEDSGFIKKTEYFDIRDAATLEEVKTAGWAGDIVIAAAVNIGGTRLIDNVVVSKKK
jgi:pantoate--beta-alanine ligase